MEDLEHNHCTRLAACHLPLWAIAGTITFLFACNAPETKTTAVPGTDSLKVAQQVQDTNAIRRQRLEEFTKSNHIRLEDMILRMQDMNAESEFDTDEPPVPSTPVRCLQDDFRSYFRSGGAPGDSIRQSIVYTDIDKLITLVNGWTLLKAGSKHGIQVVYGLEGTGGIEHFTYGLRVVELAKTDDPLIWNVEHPSKFQVVNPANGFLEEKENSYDWPDDDLYFSETVVQRRDHTARYDKVQRGFDTECYYFQWEGELEDLVAHNRPPIHTTTAKFIGFISIAEPFTRTSKAQNVDMRHHVCAATLDENKNFLLSDQTYAARFTERAVDVGSPCPPRCAKAFFPEYGMPVRLCIP